MQLYRIAFALTLISVSSACSFTIRPFVGGSAQWFTISTTHVYSFSSPAEEGKRALDIRDEFVFSKPYHYGYGGQIDLGIVSKGTMIYFGYRTNTAWTYSSQGYSYSFLNDPPDRNDIHEEARWKTNNAILGFRIYLIQQESFPINPLVGLGLNYYSITEKQVYKYTYPIYENSQNTEYRYNSKGSVLGFQLEGGFVIKTGLPIDVSAFTQYTLTEYYSASRYNIGRRIHLLGASLGLVYYLKPL